LRHPTAAVERAIHFCVLQNGNVGIPARALELRPAAKNSVIAERESEDLYGGIPERIAHAVNEWTWRKAQAKTSAYDARIGEYASDLDRCVLWHAQIGVDKPKDFTARHLSTGVHLQSAAALGSDHEVGQWLRDQHRSVRAAAIDDNDLRFRRNRPEMTQEIFN